MKRITAAVVVVVAAGIMVSFSMPAIAFDTLGMSPDQVQQMIQNNQASDSMMLELIREKSRQQQYRDQNPYSGCLPLGEVRGGSVEEAKSLGIKLGGTNIQYIETTATSVRANIYRCSK